MEKGTHNLEEIQKELEEIKKERQLLRQEFGNEFYDKVMEILFKNDPISINFGDNTDEYEPEVGTILPRLKEARSQEDLQDIIYQEFVRWFDADVASPKAKYSKISKEIWEIWKTYKK